jgi:ribonuclease J
MKLMLNLTKPKYVLPVHGDHKRLRMHAGLAESVGIPKERIFQSRNGIPLELTADGARLGDDVGAGMIFVDGLELGEPDDAALRDRRTLSADGVVIVVATVSFEDSEVAADPEITFRGVPFRDEDDSDRLLDELMDVVEDALEEALENKVREQALIRQDLHDVVAAFIHKRMKRRPMVLPVVVEV